VEHAMTLTKADIIRDLYENCNITKAEAAELAESVFEIIKQGLESGEDVLV
jgi:integration host factor subunit alpha